MYNRKYYLLLVAASLYCTPSFAQDASYIDACAKSLTVDQIGSYNTSAVQLALLSYITSSSSEGADIKAKFSGLISGGLFDGTLVGARNKQSMLEKDLKLQFNREQAQGYFGKYLSPFGAGSFSECVKTVFSSPGLHAALQSADEGTIGLLVNYLPQSGETRKFIVKIFTDGTIPEGMNMVIPSGGVRRTLTISRSNPSKDTHIQLDAEVDGVVVASQQVFVPPFYKTALHQDRVLKTSETSKSECGSYEDDHIYSGTTVSISPDDGFTFDTSTTNPQLTSLRGDLGKVPGPGSHMETTRNESYVVSGKAWCQPGNNTGAHYWVTGIVTSMMVRDTYLVTTPIDNNVMPVFKIVTH